MRHCLRVGGGWKSGVPLLFVFALTLAIPAPAQNAPAAREHVFRLEWREDGFSLDSTVLGGNREVVFEAEPQYRGKVTRGALTAGSAAGDVMGYAIDQGARKLYLDANRNRDLTDDAGSVYDVYGSDFRMTVTDVRLVVGEAPDTRSYALELKFWNRGAGVDATLRSGWEGVVTLHGEQWLVAVIDDGNGVFDQADRVAVVPGGRTRANVIDATGHETFYLCKDIFLGGHAYEVSFAFDQGAVAAAFIERDIPMGELAIEGEHITRLFLRGDRMVILDTPGKTVMVPEGSYRLGRVFMDGGEAGWFACEEQGTPVQVGPGKTAMLQAGGPLNNTLQFGRAGMSLNLRYALTGAGGVNYANITGRGAGKPRFVAYKSGTRIAEANFEYG